MHRFFISAPARKRDNETKSLIIEVPKESMARFYETMKKVKDYKKNQKGPLFYVPVL